MLFMTQFEVGKRYQTRGGGTAEVARIHPRGLYPVQVTYIGREADGPEYLDADGLLNHVGEPDPMDLLLPAIEPAKEGFSIPTLNALTEYIGFWRSFWTDVAAGHINPVNGDPAKLPRLWPDQNSSVVIECSYPTREAALSEAAAVIEDLDALLEGRAGL
jgi:hypothetical protein